MRPNGLFITDVLVESIVDGAVDQYNNPAPTSSFARTFPGSAWLATADERTAAGDLQTQQWQLALDAEAAGYITARSRVSVDGVRFEVDGLPNVVRNFRTGEISHVEATLRRTDG